MDKDKVYKKHILDAIEKIKNNVAGLKYEIFVEDYTIHDAVLHEFQIIGEATKRLSDDFKNKFDLPWQEIAGMRDRIVHDYFEVDLKVPWDAIKEDLPRLEEALKKN